MFVLYPGKREMRFDEIQRYNLSSLRPGHDRKRDEEKPQARRLAGPIGVKWEKRLLEPESAVF